MAEIFLDCQHPAIVTHDRGERLVVCAVPGCTGANVVAAHPVTEVAYEVHRAPAALIPTASTTEEHA